MAYFPNAPDTLQAGNSSDIPLLANAVFTGASLDLTQSPTAKITAQVFTDQPSAILGFTIQYSQDGTNWDQTIPVPVSVIANLSATISGGVLARYARVVYTNGPTNQTVFRLQTLTSIFPLPVAPLPVLGVDYIQPEQVITTQDLDSTSSPAMNGQFIISGTSTVGSVASFPFSGFDSIKVQVTGTWTGGLAPEISMDGGITWTLHTLHQVGGSFVVTSITANLIGELNTSGTTNFRLRALTPITGTVIVQATLSASLASLDITNAVQLSGAGGSPVAVIKGANTTPLATDPSLVVTLSPNSVGPVSLIDGQSPTYSAAIIASSLPTPANSPVAGCFFTLQGSATKTIKITRISLSCLALTGMHRSFFGSLLTNVTGGTPTVVSIGSHDSTSSPATAIANSYATGLTPSASANIPIRVWDVFISAAGNNNLGSVIMESFGNGPMQTILLRGDTEFFGLSFLGGTITGGLVNAYIEWIEV